MPFTSSQQHQIEEHLRDHNNACPVCRTNRWEIFEDLIASVAIDVEYKQIIQGKFLPMVALICSDCGFVRQIGAGKIGLL